MAAKFLSKHLRNELVFIMLVIILNRLSEYLQPLILRKIHPEEVWLYKNPQTPSFITSNNNIVICIIVPIAVLGIFYSFKKNVQDLLEGCLGCAFSGGVTGIVTNIIKNIACRPRPDFFERCFPDGVYRDGMPVSCTGDSDVIIEGMKSFPSGHSSLAFASLGFTTLYIAGKLQCFNQKGRAPWWLVVAFLPSLGALLIGVSRTADYHHHWQDVLVGSLIGIVIAYVTYRQRFPPLSHSTCHTAYACLSPLSTQLQDKDIICPQRQISPDPESTLKIV